MSHRAFTESTHDHALFLELLGDVLGAGAGDIDPSLGRKNEANEKGTKITIEKKAQDPSMKMT